MFADIHSRVNHKIIAGKIDGLLFTEILYADDTLLVLKKTRETNIRLKEIQIESFYYNMKLNKDKCEAIAIYEHNQITF